MIKEILAEDLYFSNENLEVFLFNVGQGDHIMLKFPNYEYGIIDFYYDAANNIKEPPCLSYFKELKSTISEKEFKKITISFFCISHTDKDHIKGVTDTIKWFHDNGIFVRDFWLCAAKDESQFYDYLKQKIEALVENLELKDKIQFRKNIEFFNTKVQEFFSYFEKWKLKEFKSDRYKKEEIGTGEYLCEIRSLRKPCSTKNSKAINMGPLYTSIDEYINNMTFDLLMKILGVNKTTTADRNLISHILRIKYGEINLLFGGDTHKEIWEECLDKYENNAYTFKDDFGSFDSHFIKVSHHGSKNSSSPSIWERSISNNGKAYLGISAGQHEGHKHPHSETISQIRNARNNADILCTNVCHDCVMSSPYEKEHHIWYDLYSQKYLSYGKKKPNEYDLKINHVISQASDKNIKKDERFGLLAYIFEINEDPNCEIKVRICLARTIEKNECFYKLHGEKLNSSCSLK